MKIITSDAFNGERVIDYDTPADAAAVQAAGDRAVEALDRRYPDTPTETDPEIIEQLLELWLGEKAGLPADEWEVILHNDEERSASEVTNILLTKLGLDDSEAIEATLRTTTDGEGVVYSGSYESAFGAVEVLQHHGLYARMHKVV